MFQTTNQTSIMVYYGTITMITSSATELIIHSEMVIESDFMMKTIASGFCTVI